MSNKEKQKAEQKNQTKQQNNEEISLLKKEIDELRKKNESLIDEINKMNQNYVEKINKKAIEAKAIVDAKIKEFEQKQKTEIEQIKKFAFKPYALELIDVVNQLESVLSFEPSDPKIKNYQVGFKMYLSMLKNILEKGCIKEIPIAIGDEFNPEYMECFETQQSAELEDNKVVKIIKKGYKIHDILLSPALVVVCKK